jgi:hypothetical protein
MMGVYSSKTHITVLSSCPHHQHLHVSRNTYHLFLSSAYDILRDTLFITMEDKLKKSIRKFNSDYGLLITFDNGEKENNRTKDKRVTGEC